uniref:Uncharacterized protein n=1 Tax=Ditylenchus dipsaci TaxID=166011 RepID=A0A915EVB8_9BILA
MYKDTLSTSCSLQELQQYSNSGKWMVKRVHLDQFGPEWLSAKWKSTLESINPLWQGSILRMRITEYIAKFQEINNWSTLQKFDQIALLIRRDDNIQLQQLPSTLLYNFSIIQFFLWRCQLNLFDILIFLENIPKDRQGKLIVQLRFCWCIMHSRKKLLRLAKQSFYAAKLPYSYELHIVQEPHPKRDAKKVFQRVNEKTKEILQCYIDQNNKDTTSNSSVTVVKRSSL